MLPALVLVLTLPAHSRHLMCRFRRTHALNNTRRLAPSIVLAILASRLACADIHLFEPPIRTGGRVRVVQAAVDERGDAKAGEEGHLVDVCGRDRDGAAHWLGGVGSVLKPVVTEKR